MLTALSARKHGKGFYELLRDEPEEASQLARLVHAYLARYVKEQVPRSKRRLRTRPRLSPSGTQGFSTA